MSDELSLNGSIDPPTALLDPQTPEWVDQRIANIETAMAALADIQTKIFAQTSWLCTEIDQAKRALAAMPGMGRMMGGN